MDSPLVPIRVDDQLFQADIGDNLLSACLHHQVDVAYSCRAGGCGTCALYDDVSKSTVLACQTIIKEPLTLSCRLPSHTHSFHLISRTVKDDAHLELVLVGPSDDVFGDFVELILCDEKETTIECMALNLPGNPLLISIAKSKLSGDHWAWLLSPSTSVLMVKIRRGERKGRLLSQFDLEESPVWLVFDTATAPLEVYWKEAMSFCRAIYQRPIFVQKNDDLKDVMSSVFNERRSTNGDVIIQSDSLTKRGWDQLLATFYFRSNQIHMVRTPQTSI